MPPFLRATLGYSLAAVAGIVCVQICIRVMLYCWTTFVQPADDFNYCYQARILVWLFDGVGALIGIILFATASSFKRPPNAEQR